MSAASSSLEVVPSASVALEPTSGELAVEPPPGSESVVYGPNPGAIVVAIDPGHGGCLDWGVPDPSARGVELAEKTLVLEIAERLRDRLTQDGIGVVMLREGDQALAGDLEPDYGCNGPDWRDVDGDGNAGFEETGRIRTRDELQARIDRANLAGADAFVSIHINSLTENGVIFEIAATQTFYDDETAWGEERSAPLADAVQSGVVAALDPLAGHERQDRGTEAVAYYAISRTWSDTDTCEAPGDTWCKPHRGLAMPGILSEVGSITSREDHDLLASDEGQQAVANGLFDGIAAWFRDRGLAARVALADAPIAEAPEPVDGEGPPFWAPVVDQEGPIRLRVTNTGTEPIAAGARLVAGWEPSDAPYLAAPPAAMMELGPALPALEAGASVVVTVELAPPAAAERALAWIALAINGAPLTGQGSPALQVANRDPAP